MIIITALFFALLIGGVVNTNTINEVYSICSVFAISFFVVLYTLNRFKDFRSLLLIAFLVRLVILFVDYYKFFPIFGSGSDTEYFYTLSVAKADGASVDPLTNYTLFLTALFKLIGPQRLFAQFINVLCSYGTILFIIKAIELTNYNNKKVLVPFVVIASFTPQVVFFSGILLRESIITLFLSISVYYYIKFLQEKQNIYVLFIFGSLFVCTFFHTGMIMGLLAYSIVLMLYDRTKDKMVLSTKKIFALLLVVSVLVFIISSSTIFTSYFNGIIEGEDREQAMLDKLNYDVTAGSAYLTSIKFDSPSTIVMYLPLKIVYFLFSPMPWDFRGFTDIISFLLESSVFIYLFYVIFRKNRQQCFESWSLVLVFFFLCILYAIGTTTAGTAIRHRDTILPALVVAAAFSAKRQNSV